MDIASEISARILELCALKGLTINKLADRSGLTQSTVDSIVSRKSRNPQINTIAKICEGFEISLSEFFAFDSAHAAPDLTNLPEHIKKELATATEFVLYKHGIKKAATD